MRKISRRLFLLVFLSACSSFRPATRPYLTGPLPTFVPEPTLTGQPAQQSATPTGQPVQQATTPTGQPTQQAMTSAPINQVVSDSDTNCQTPIVAPTEPAVIPAVGGVDETTGRHMMGTVQVLDVQSYRLTVTGVVDHPLSLTYDDLRCMPKMTETVTTKCYAFSDTATWSGVLISEVLKKAGVQPSAKKVTQKGADDAIRTVTLDMAMDAHNFLAYQMGDKPLPILFGFPVRSIIIDVAGQYSVKWLTELEVI